MKRPPRNRNRLQVEQLENRNLLAGNVSVHLSGGNLHIHGDDLSNAIAIESFAGGAVQVRGFDDFSLVPTSVNNAPNGLRLFYGVTGDIVVHMGGGADLVRISNLVVQKNLAIDLGSGADELIMGRDAFANATRFGDTPSGPLYVQGQFTLLAGTEADFVFQSDVHIVGPSTIDLGTGDDTLLMQRPAFSFENVEYFGDLTILPKEGNDVIDITGLISRSLTINDEFGVMNVSITSADVYGTLKFVSQGFDDFVSVNATNVRGDIHVESRAGNDLFSFFGIARKITVHSGDGNDTLRISNSSIDELLAQLGSGNDLLELNNVFARLVTVYGGDGNDIFEVFGLTAQEANFYGDKNFDIYREPIVPPNQIRRLRLYTIEQIQTF